MYHIRSRTGGRQLTGQGGSWARNLDGLLEVGGARLLANGFWHPFGRPPVFLCLLLDYFQA